MVANQSCPLCGRGYEGIRHFLICSEVLSSIESRFRENKLIIDNVGTLWDLVNLSFELEDGNQDSMYSYHAGFIAHILTLALNHVRHDRCMQKVSFEQHVVTVTREFCLSHGKAKEFIPDLYRFGGQS